MPPIYPRIVNLNPLEEEERLSSLNDSLAQTLQPQIPPPQSIYANKPDETMAVVEAYKAAHPEDAQTTMIADTPVALSKEHGVSNSTGSSADLAGASYEVLKKKAEEHAITARANALGMLQDALSRSNYISPSQGAAAALLAAIPALGGMLIGRAVKSPKLPEGVYFPKMGYSEFKDMFNVGGNAATAEGIQAGKAAATDYFGRIEKDNLANDKIQDKMAELALQKANKFEATVSQIEMAQSAAQERALAREDSQANARAISEAVKKREYEGLTPEQAQNLRAKKSGMNADGTPYVNPANAFSPTQESELASFKDVEMTATRIADRIGDFKTFADLKAALNASHFDDKAIIADLQALVAMVVKSYSGTAASDKERETIEQFVKGDMSADAQIIRNYLLATAARARNSGGVRINTYQSLADPTKQSTLFQDPMEARKARIAAIAAKGGG